MNTDLTYQVKMVVWLRELLNKKQRAYDGEDTWTPEDEAQLQKVIAVDKEFYYSADLDIDLSDIDLAIISKEKLKELLKKLGKAINKLHGSNMPPPEILEESTDALNKHQAKIQEQNSKVASFSAQRIKLISIFCSRFGISKDDAGAFVDLATANIENDQKFSVQEVLSVLENLDNLTGRNSDQLANYVVTSILSPVLVANQDYISIMNFVATDTGLPEGSTAANVTAIAGFAGETPLQIVITPEVDSVLVDIVGVTQATKEKKYFDNPKIAEAVKQAQEIYTQSQTTTDTIKKDFSKSEIKDEDAENQAIAAIKFAVPMLAPVYNKAKKEISNPSQLHQFEMFLKAMSIQYAKKYGLLLSPGAISIIEKSPLDKFFELVEFQQEISTQEEIRLTQDLAIKSNDTETTKTERAETVLAFASDIINLKDDFTLENVSTVANKWFNLEKIDSELDKYFSDKDNLQYAQFQNWMAGVFAKFMGPEAEKLVNLLKPLNKIFWLLVDKSGLGQLLLWLKKTFKKWVGMNLLFGAVAGIGAFLIMGPLVGLGAGIITYFITPSPTGTAGGTLSSTAMRVNLAISHVATATTASFFSFLTVVFVVFLSIPIVIALLLFIINTSALIVPPMRGPLDYPGLNLPDFVISGTCPVVENPCISRGSLGGLHPSRGHGDSSYGKVCYGIPISGMWVWYDKPSNDESLSRCTNTRSRYSCNGINCPYFGFAADIRSTSNRHSPVALPKLCSPNETSLTCDEMQWKVTNIFYNCYGGDSPSRDACLIKSFAGATKEEQLWGWGVVFESNNNGHKWKLYLNHIDIKPSVSLDATFNTGQVIGNITRDWVDHAHLELVVDGIPARPDYMCNQVVACPGT